MIITYECSNKECSKYQEQITRDVQLKDLDNNVIQLCDECNKEVQRVWNFSGGIRTSDGYKS